LTVSGDNIVSYSWSPSAGLSNTNSSNPVATPSQTTTYSVTVTNNQGSTTTVSLTVTVREDYNVIAHNILTPNGDGVNDTWFVDNINSYPKAEIKIFDKSGRIIYHKAEGYTNDWNAQLNTNNLISDVYYYIINFGRGLSVKKGFITVIR
jgi:gliding motility-associated-like protein